MTRLYIVVEGSTELEFVKRTLAPHLNATGVWTTPIEVTTKRHRRTRAKLARGGGHWKHWRRDLDSLRNGTSSDARFTTLFDLYGLPHDFPGLDTHKQEPDTVVRAERLERAMAEAIDDDRFIPYLQRHEFEALVLAGLEHLSGIMDEPRDQQGIEDLKAALGDVAPEDVNDGADTHPSKRLTAHLPGYRKPLHGPAVTDSVGITDLKRLCTRFGAWVKLLEGLGAGGTAPAA